MTLSLLNIRNHVPIDDLDGIPQARGIFKSIIKVFDKAIKAVVNFIKSLFHFIKKHFKLIIIIIIVVVAAYVVWEMLPALTAVAEKEGIAGVISAIMSSISAGVGTIFNKGKELVGTALSFINTDTLKKLLVPTVATIGGVALLKPYLPYVLCGLIFYVILKVMSYARKD